MNPLARSALLAVVVAATTPVTIARADQPTGQPGPLQPAPELATPVQPEPAPERSDGDEGGGPSMALGIGGLAVGIAGLAAAVGLLAAAEDRSTEALDLSKTIKAETPVPANQCNGPLEHASCDDLKSAADDKVTFTAAGFFLLVAGSTLTLTSALYLSVGGSDDESTADEGRHNEDGDNDVAVQVMPTLGPSQWGATVGGTF